MKNINLSPQTPEHALHSTELSEFIKEKIEESNSKISFAKFMEYVLYAPNLGYYTAYSEKFGPQGDFTTAPELSPVFAQTLANQCYVILNDIENSAILEFGAGSGILAIELIQQLEKLNSLPQKYYILEISPDLTNRQKQQIKQKLPKLYDLFIWLDKLPEKFDGIVIANEVLDAMPIERFNLSNNNIYQSYVKYINNTFTEEFILTKEQDFVTIKDKLKHLDDYTSEFNPYLKGWINSLYDIGEKIVTFIIDYGFAEHEYFHPDRKMGTLMCHYQHHAHPNPFTLLGLQDITAHVNFTEIAEHAYDIGWHIAGFTTQAGFLISNNVIQFADSIQNNQAIKMLTSPAEMGDLFKVIALSKNYQQPIQGFEFLDMRNKL